MLPVQIDYTKCNGCGFCERNCPGDLIYPDGVTGLPYIKYPEECWLCGACRIDCPKNCIVISFPLMAL